MSEAPLVDPDPSRARTLPARYYVGEAHLDLERERVFARTWQLAGRSEQVRGAGDYFTTAVAGEPIVVVRDAAGTLRALSAVCRHRAGPIATGAGCRKVFQCAYHGWTYGVDGRLLGTPEFEGVEEFAREDHSLPAARVEEWGGFVFVNLDADAAPLTTALGPIPADTAHLPTGALKPDRVKDYEIACNWKVYVDNFVEGYHIPLVHPRLFRTLDYEAYRVEPDGLVSRQHAPFRDDRSDAVYAEASQGPRYYWVFPNLMLNFYPDNLQLNLVLPLGPERTLTRFEWYLLDPDRPGAREQFEAGYAFAEEVQREDMAICEAVQRGLRSRAYDAGRYSVRRENGVHHFHSLLSRFLGEPAAPSFGPA